MRQRSRHRRQQDVADLNVTAFMNLMVVLVPFLLVMAVFSRLAIHELNMPGESTAEQEQSEQLNLEVVVREDQLILQDRSGNSVRRIQAFPNQDGEYDLAGLSKKLQEVKAQLPDMTAASVLLEPSIAYDHVIQVMDTVRVYEAEKDGETIKAELFPEISLGDAPIVGKGSS